MGARRRRSDRAAARAAMRSPGRPSVGRREQRQRFWAAIARGVSSEDAAGETGVSGAVGVRWFPRKGAAASGPQARGRTSLLPWGPTRTALCRALPRSHRRHGRNHIVQPLPQVPARGLPVIVTGSPGTAML